MFIAGGVLSSFTVEAYGEMLFGPEGIFCCNTASGHWDKLEARLSSGAISSSNITFMYMALFSPLEGHPLVHGSCFPHWKGTH